ncbi:ComEC/Rec2 family competence protein [Exiguobacterium sp. SL-9]|uniref:ComEC/Rec2 family competence protein n=1 Tax=Exiguobacterium sp. SL-9 TaxID=2510963 RepID=UPI00103A2A81|nr:ComEC/Rec2 family competence protein [Exiguobacterium sp. SL-9]TCI20430.1 MBL fold metallo-hydrolase [Exiguobacterium sp. SL-9]
MNKLIKIGSAVLFSGALLVSPYGEASAAASIKVHYIDVGQGDAIYIKMPSGEDVIIDGGNKGKGDAIVAYLKKQKVDDIEVLISTHPDADHIGGLDEILDAYRVENVYAPKVKHTTQAYKDFLQAVKREGKTIKKAQAGVKLPIKGVSAKFVGPVKSYSNSDLNNWSAVLHVTYKKNTFLFTGDAEHVSEKDMMAKKQTLRADVLKVGHHGAKTSTSSTFLNTVKPKHAIISVGKNSYGHPTSEVVTNLKRQKANTLRTDKNGTIIITGNGTSYAVKKSK